MSDEMFMGDAKQRALDALIAATNDLEGIERFAATVADNAVAKGFRVEQPERDKETAATMTMNEVSEISEFWEAWRAGALDKPCDKAAKMAAVGLEPLTAAEEEIADSIIRALDRASVFGIDVRRALAVKHAFNVTRPMLHGGKKA